MAGVANFKDAVSAAFAAATPPNDGSGASYARVDTFSEERSDGQHRQFFWGPPEDTQNLEFTRPNRGWILSCFVYVARRDRTLEDFHDACEEEKRVLMDAYDGLTALGTAVYEGVIQNSPDEESAEPPPVHLRSGGIPRATFARLKLTFQVMVGG